MAPVIIGAVESVAIKELDFSSFVAKVDTGAKSSSLHCDSIRLEGDMVHFSIDFEDGSKAYVLRTAMIQSVRSSNGIAQPRIFVYLTLGLGSCEVTTLVSLTDRSSMKYPMLLGRRFLCGRFLVDCSRTFCCKEK